MRTSPLTALKPFQAATSWLCGELVSNGNGKRLLLASEIDQEYRVKDDFLRALIEHYNVKVFGVGDPLYLRDEVESAIIAHGHDGRPTIKTMRDTARKNKKAQHA